MNAPDSTTFDATRALAEIDTWLAGPVPAGGPTVDEREPYTENWLASHGDGFVIAELWQGRDLLGVYDQEWTAAQEAASGHLDELTRALDARWGSHREIGTRIPVCWAEGDPPLPPLYAQLRRLDALGTLHVWGPVRAPGGDADRWLSVSVNQIDGDRPFFLVVAVTDRPIEDLEDEEG
ncbi:hypothetical protein ACFYVL_15830 [Streptomyces sp. NPDC004111]|uniref:hypothetical protein n=1 Tax=Streptomyces sp. NPDC004111 TaxID=3364690 RepID=UPI0036BAAE07